MKKQAEDIRRYQYMRLESAMEKPEKNGEERCLHKVSIGNTRRKNLMN